MEDKKQYLSLLAEIIKKQALILGPDIAILKARSIPGLKVDDTGQVIDVEGDPKVVIQNLVSIYVELSGLIVKNALSSVFERYPSISDV